VIACNPMPIQMTQLLYDYITLDPSGKVRDYLQTIKLFASSHHISDPAGGYLSITAWYVMALHVLLKHKLVPNIHMSRLYRHTKEGGGVATTVTISPRPPTPVTLTEDQQAVLVETPLLVLLDLFFRYYVEQIDIFSSIVTLRDEGSLMPKSKWPANPVLWRISIEDPFESVGGFVKPYDLGCTLSRPGQLTVLILFFFIYFLFLFIYLHDFKLFN